jgi:hypothetical protein
VGLVINVAGFVRIVSSFYKALVEGLSLLEGPDLLLLGNGFTNLDGEASLLVVEHGRLYCAAPFLPRRTLQCWLESVRVSLPSKSIGVLVNPARSLLPALETLKVVDMPCSAVPVMPCKCASKPLFLSMGVSD